MPTIDPFEDEDLGDILENWDEDFNKFPVEEVMDEEDKNDEDICDFTL